MEVKRLVTSFGVCGGSGGGGAFARALVEVKAGRTYRVEAGHGGRSRRRWGAVPREAKVAECWRRVT